LLLFATTTMANVAAVVTTAATATMATPAATIVVVVGIVGGVISRRLGGRMCLCLAGRSTDGEKGSFITEDKISGLDEGGKTGKKW
jgi:hypothetical protein